jgi:hypothetical protein
MGSLSVNLSQVNIRRGHPVLAGGENNVLPVLAGNEEDAHPALAGGLPAAPPLRGPVAPTLRVHAAPMLGIAAEYAALFRPMRAYF